MRNKIFIVIAFILISNFKLFAQNSEVKVYNGVFLEYNTLLRTHNLKLFTDLNYYKDENVVMSLQPGAELIVSFADKSGFYRGSPYYDINLLGAITLFPNYGISIKPFLGISYRFKANAISENSSSFNIKYGSTLQLNIYKNFMIIGKIMNIPTIRTDDVPILVGVGIAFLLF